MRELTIAGYSITGQFIGTALTGADKRSWSVGADLAAASSTIFTLINIWREKNGSHGCLT
jgi:hypothetical protein